MNLKLVRKEFRQDGIFSELYDEQDNLIAHTLEHAYDDGAGGWAPKIPDGTFTCQRGPHRLHGMDHDFETFEITGVEGHKDLLFHWGNYNKDSEGCILLGKAEVDDGKQHMVTSSRVEFAEFIKMQAGIDQFELVVCESESTSA